MNQNELTHHGIKGQKWGVIRFGYKKSNRKRKSIEESNKKRFSITNKHKSMIKSGVLITAGILATYGAYKLSSASGTNLSVNIKKLIKPESIEETLKSANPWRQTKDYRNNCVSSAIAGIFRRRGLDVTAIKDAGDGVNMIGAIETIFKNARVIDGYASSFTTPEKASKLLLNKFGKNAEGTIGFMWKSNHDNGHTFSYKIKDGMVRFFDDNTGKDDGFIRMGYFNRIDPNGLLQLSNIAKAEINWDNIDEIKKYIDIR